MDKNEFYKQLLSSYTTDAERIKCSAKRGLTRHRTVALRKVAGFAGAAMITLSVGVAVLFSVFAGRDISVLSKTDPETAIARLRNAEANYLSSALSERQDVTAMYVSFSVPLSIRETFMVFSAISDYGDIRCELFYDTENNIISCTGENTNTEILIAGAKVVAPANYYKDIQNLKSVSLVELEADGITDETFIPLSSEDKESAAATANATEISDVDIIIPTDTSTPDVSTEAGTDITGAETSGTVPDETTDTPTTIPEAGVLAELQGVNPISVNFISDKTFVVLSNASVELYRINEDNSLSLDTKIYTNNPKISWSSGDGTELFITGCDQDGLRKKLYYANGSAGTLSEMDVSTITADAELTAMIVCGKENAIIFKTVSLEKSRIYLAVKNGNLLKTSLAAELECPLSTLAYTGGILYYSTTDNATGESVIWAKNTTTAETVQIAAYPASAQFVKAYMFDSFAVLYETESSESKCRMLSGGAVIEVEASGTLEFSTLNSSVFKDTNGWHSISADGVSALSDADAAAYNILPVGSRFYRADINGQVIRIIIK